MAKDLKSEFPEMKGFSPRNLRYLRDFALLDPDFPNLQALPAKLEHTAYIQENTILQAALGKLTSYHHITLLDKVKDIMRRQFYIFEEKTKWSVALIENINIR